MTAVEFDRLSAARDAALVAAWNAVRDAAWDAALVAARDAAWVAAWHAARGAAWGAAWGAALAVVTWDLATDDGPYTTAHRDLLIAPWREVIGEPTDLVEVES